jgi:hypothetical protein
VSEILGANVLGQEHGNVDIAEATISKLIDSQLHAGIG